MSLLSPAWLLLVLVTCSQGDNGDLPKVHIFEEGIAEIKSSFSLSCTLLDTYSGQGKLDYIWFKASLEIRVQSSPTLHFARVGQEDKGTYMCSIREVSTGISSAPSNAVTLRVYTAEEISSRPHIRISNPAIEGKTFSMECVSPHRHSDTMELRYTWFKDSSLVKEQMSPVFEFLPAKEEYDSVYACTATDVVKGTTSAPSHIFDLEVLVSPVVQIEPATEKAYIRGILGKKLTLNCTVTRAFPGVPEDGYSWSYSPSPGTAAAQPLEGKARTLSLGPLTREQGGRYVCQARNDQVFTGLLTPGEASTMVDVVYLENITLTRDLEGSEGNTVSLTCSVDSNPVAHLAWMKNKEEVRHVVNNKDTYMVPRAACSDSTTYTCRASNPDLPGLELTAHSRVRVKCTPVKPEVRIEISPTYKSPDTVEEGRTITLTCHVVRASPPVPSDGFHWSFSQDSPASRKKTFLTMTNVLKLEEVSLSMSGWYTCEADSKTDLGMGTRSIYLKVAESPARLSHKKKQTSTTVIVILVVLVILILLFAAACYCKRKSFHFFGKRTQGFQGSQPLLSQSSQEDEVDAMQTFMGEDVSLLKTLFLLDDQESSEDDMDTNQACTGEAFGGYEPVLLLDGEDSSEDIGNNFKNGEIYTFPPVLQTRAKFFKESDIRIPNDPLLPSSIGNKAMMMDDVKAESGKHIPKGELAEDTVIKRLHNQLKKVTKPGDPPIFIFPNLKLSEKKIMIDVFILHQRLGAVIVEVKAVDRSKAFTRLGEAAKHLMRARDDIRSDLQGLLKSDAVTLLLAVPNLTDAEEARKHVGSPDVQLLVGSDMETQDAWLQRLLRQDRQPWENKPNYQEAFHTAVSKYLPRNTADYKSPFCKATRQLAEVHSHLLINKELNAALQCKEALIYLQGLPGVGTPLLLVRKARQWLQEGKLVFLAVGSPDYQLLLDHLERASCNLFPSTDAAKRLRLCRNASEFERKMEEVREQTKQESICVIGYELEESVMFSIIDGIRSMRICQAWIAGQNDMKPSLLKRFRKQRGRRLRLTRSIRNAPHILELATAVQEREVTCYPNLPARSPTASVKITRHKSHRGNHTLRRGPPPFECEDCEEWLKSSLAPLVDGLEMSSAQWRQWVILATGDIGSDKEVTSKLVTWLRKVGVPALHEWPTESRGHQPGPSPTATSSRPAEDGDGSQVVRRRVASSLDSGGSPAVHVLPAVSFTGLEKPCVLLIHWDHRDEDPQEQTESKRSSRKSEHRDQWFRAVTCCQAELAVCLLSASPAEPLLRQYIPPDGQGAN